MWVLILLLTSGCIIPIPNQQLHALGMMGRVVDENGKPISHAIVTDNGINAKYRRKNITDAEGYFRMEPVRRWHGGFLFAIPMSYSICPFFYLPEGSEEISITVDGMPTQNYTIGFRVYGEGHDCIKKGDYLIAKEITLYPPITSNYLATVMHQTGKDSRDIVSVNLYNNKSDMSLKYQNLVGSITDTTQVATILSAMVVPAEMIVNTTQIISTTPNEDILCYMVFIDDSSNVLHMGHVIYYDGTIKNAYVDQSLADKTIIYQREPNIKWKLKNKELSQFVYGLLLKKE